MSDKDAATLKAWVQTFKAQWLAASQSLGGPLLPLLTSLPKYTLPFIAAGTIDPKVVDILSVFRELAPFAQDSAEAIISDKLYFEYLSVKKGSFHDEGNEPIALPVAPVLTQPFGSWGSTYPNLITGRARALYNAIISVSKEAPSWESPSNARSSLSKLLPHAFALADTPLVQFFSNLIDRTALICYFHSIKAMKEWIFGKHLITAAEMTVTWKEEIKPACKGLFYASLTDLEGVWLNFKKTFNPRFPLFVEYMDKEWMSDKWRFLWTKAGRNDIARYLIDTSNGAETSFKTEKHDLLHGKRPTDLVTFIELMYGSPLNALSQSRSYLNKMYIELTTLYYALQSRELSNSTLPERLHIDKLREEYVKLSVVLSVRALHRHGQYAVATESGREKMSLGIPLEALVDEDFYYVDLFRDYCSCPDPKCHCKHLLRARAHHVFIMKLPRTWVDAELSLVVPLEQKSTLLTPAQMAQALAAGTDNVTEAVVSFSDLNSVSQTVPATIDAAWSAAVISLDSTRALIHQVSREPLTATSTGDELKARGRFLALASRLISSINGLKAAAATLSGDRAMQNAGGQHARQLREGPGGGGRIAAANRAALTATPAFALPVGHFAGGTPIQGLHLLGAMPAVTVIRNIDDDGETRTAGQVRARDTLNPIPSPIRKKIPGVAVAAPVQQVVAVPTVTVGGAPVPQVPQVTRKR